MKLLWLLAFILLPLVIYALGNLNFVSAKTPLTIVPRPTAVKFPNGVDFSVNVFGESEIVEVKLSLRNPIADTWNYAYMNIETGHNVEGSYTLDTSTNTYIPPGAMVEYFFTARDAEGNVEISDRKTFVYEDTRFEWQFVTIGDLTISWHDQPIKNLRSIEENIFNALNRIDHILQGGAGEPISGVIYNSRIEAAEAFPALSNTLDEEHIFQGFAFSKWNMFTGVGLRVDLIAHEVAHLRLHHATKATIPAWLNEGFASYCEPSSVYESAEHIHMRKEPYMPLRNMVAVTGNIPDIRYFYRKSESVVGYLLESYGEDRFRNLLGKLATDRGIDRALYDTYGFDQDGLEREWLVNSRNLFQTAIDEEDNLFLKIENGFLGVLVLVVLLLLFLRFVARRLMPKNSEEHGSW